MQPVAAVTADWSMTMLLAAVVVEEDDVQLMRLALRVAVVAAASLRMDLQIPLVVAVSPSQDHSMSPVLRSAQAVLIPSA